MSNSGLSKAWGWSVEASPLLNLCRRLRYMGYPNHKAFALLEAAGLPKPVDALIRKTVSKSKLWASERAEIARELIAHAQDAIEAGRTGEEIVESFGDPKRIAKLMRRSMKRKRPLYWRAYRNMKRATVAMGLVLIVGYGSLAARFYMGTPSINRNIIAELNAQNDGYSEDQKAWSVYRSVDIEWQRLTLAAWDIHQGTDGHTGTENAYRNSWLSELVSLERNDQQFIEGAQSIRAFEPHLAKIREAAHRPVSGMLFSDQQETVEIEPGIYATDPIEPSADPSMQETLAYVLLPDLGMIRRFSHLLKFDTELAIVEGDYQRASGNLSAILGLSRQVNKAGFLINHLVAIAIIDDLSSSLKSLLNDNPNVLTTGQLIELSHRLAMTKSQVQMELDGEAMFFDDVLQRAYTDAGDGNGRITRQGMEMLAGDWVLSGNLDADDPMQINGLVKSLAGPISMVVMEDRQTQHRRYQAMMQTIYRTLRDGPEALGGVQVASMEFSDQSSIPQTPIDMLMPAYGRAVEREFLSHMRVDATLAMLAIEIFKREHGDYPETLEELVPRYLPELPADYFNPGYSIQYVIVGDGYLLYSAGTDGDLDGGVDLKPSNNKQYSLMKRFGVKTEMNAKGSMEVVRDAQGDPVLRNPTEPDSDWNLIDLRRLTETVPEPITGE